MVEVENHREIEELGSKAAVEYMRWHSSLLEKLALETHLDSYRVKRDDDRNTSMQPMTLSSRPENSLLSQQAQLVVLTASPEQDRRFYAMFMSNLGFMTVDQIQHQHLCTERWRNLLPCLNGRIPDFNFMTLLRPDTQRTYHDQQSELLIVPRAQFVLIEIARLYQGCYDIHWCRKERLRLARDQFLLWTTPKFTVLSKRCLNAAPTTQEPGDPPLKDHNKEKDLFKQELHRQVTMYHDNLEAAQRGDQLQECWTADQARRAWLPYWNDTTTTMRIKEALGRLDSIEPGGVVVLDHVLDDDTCRRIEQAALEYFHRCGGDTRIEAQRAHRGDQVCFVPLFLTSQESGSSSKDTWDTPLREAKAILANVAFQSTESAVLLVPRVGQLALYDGLSMYHEERPGYVAHYDNCTEPGELGENYREITAILYLNQAQDHKARGGVLRCYPNADDLNHYQDIAPRTGRMVLFHSRKLCHEVTPVVGWRRLAVSVWILKDCRMGCVSSA